MGPAQRGAVPGWRARFGCRALLYRRYGRCHLAVGTCITKPASSRPNLDDPTTPISKAKNRTRNEGLARHFARAAAAGGPWVSRCCPVLAVQGRTPRNMDPDPLVPPIAFPFIYVLGLYHLPISTIGNFIGRGNSSDVVCFACTQWRAATYSNVHYVCLVFLGAKVLFRRSCCYARDGDTDKAGRAGARGSVQFWSCGLTGST